MDQRLETRELAYFVAVAEELHFGRAAARLGIAAPPLSRAIAQLERRVGARLFDRTSRRVELTDTGRVFLADSRAALAAVDTALRRARQAGQPGKLAVAIRSGTGTDLLTDLVEGYARHPDAVAVRVVFTIDQAAAVRDGTADVAILCATNDLSGLTTTSLTEERPVALLPAAHGLAGSSGLSLDALRQDPAFREECPALAFDEIVDMVALNQLIVMVGHSAVSRVGAGVTAVPLTGVPPTKLVLARPSGVPVPAVRAFERVAADVAARRAAHL